MAIRYEDLSPEEKAEFDKGYDDWKNSLPNGGEPTAADVGAMARDAGFRQQNPLIVQFEDDLADMAGRGHSFSHGDRRAVNDRIVDMAQELFTRGEEIRSQQVWYEELAAKAEQVREIHNIRQGEALPGYLENIVGSPSEPDDIRARAAADEKSSRDDLESDRQTVYEYAYYLESYDWSKAPAGALPLKNGMPDKGGMPLLESRAYAALGEEYSRYATNRVGRSLDSMRARQADTPQTGFEGVDFTKGVQQPEPSVQKDAQKAAQKDARKPVYRPQRGYEHEDLVERAERAERQRGGAQYGEG